MTPYTTEDAKIDPKTNPLFQRLFGKEGFLPLNEANLEEFLAVPGLKMAVFAEDPNAKRVTMDIVVIAPELKKAFAGALDRALRAVNSDYDAKRRTTLEQQRIVEVPRGFFLTENPKVPIFFPSSRYSPWA